MVLCLAGIPRMDAAVAHVEAIVGRRPVPRRPRVTARNRPGPPSWAFRAIGTAACRAGRVGHLDVAAARHLGLVFAVYPPRPGVVVAYLLNVWILSPVAPLTGQYSRGGLN